MLTYLCFMVLLHVINSLFNDLYIIFIYTYVEINNYSVHLIVYVFFNNDNFKKKLIPGTNMSLLSLGCLEYINLYHFYMYATIDYC